MGHLRCGAVVIALNEEKKIVGCLESLKNQTVEVFIVVVNDGSTDGTAEVASKYADVVVNLPHHRESWTGRPELARVFNAGFKILRDKQIDYVLISGADDNYPSKYVEEITTRMRVEHVVLASGIAEGEVTRSLSPRGGGRALDAKWFRRVGFQYPVNYGFEVYLVFKALSEDRKVVVFPDLKFKASRRTSVSRRRLYLWGKGMKALNYGWLYALGRAAILGIKNPSMGPALLAGYLSQVPRQYDDIKHFVPIFQKRIFIKRLQEVLTGKASYTDQTSVD